MLLQRASEALDQLSQGKRAERPGFIGHGISGGSIRIGCGNRI